jgi:hypothetical protein
MRNPGGCLTIVNRDGSKEESDTITCGHCGGIDAVPAGCQPADFCRQCYKAVCSLCGQLPQCRPFEKWLDMKERSGRFRNLIG